MSEKNGQEGWKWFISKLLKVIHPNHLTNESIWIWTLFTSFSICSSRGKRFLTTHVFVLQCIVRRIILQSVQFILIQSPSVIQMMHILCSIQFRMRCLCNTWCQSVSILIYSLLHSRRMKRRHHAQSKNKGKKEIRIIPKSRAHIKNNRLLAFLFFSNLFCSLQASVLLSLFTSCWST